MNTLDYLRLAEAAAQAVAEIRAVVDWLLQEGCPGVALWGTSMGARLAGLTLCHESRLAAVVMAAPGVRSNRSFAEVICWPRTRKIVQQLDGFGERLDLTPLNLTRNLPKANRRVDGAPGRQAISHTAQRRRGLPLLVMWPWCWRAPELFSLGQSPR